MRTFEIIENVSTKYVIAPGRHNSYGHTEIPPAMHVMWLAAQDPAAVEHDAQNPSERLKHVF